MRIAGVLLVICVGCSEQETPAPDPNPNLTVEPITADAGVPQLPAKNKKRIGMGDHRRREDEDTREYRRRKSRADAPPAAETAKADPRKEDEERRHEAERHHMTNAPLDVYTNPTGQISPIQTR